MAFILKGNDYLVSISGGYLFVTLDGNELATISVPSPVFADNYRNSISENDDEFQDEYNNHYIATVRSSSAGVDWKITVTASRPEDEAELMDRINVEYQPNGV